MKLEIKERELISKRLSKYIAFFLLFWQVIKCFVNNNWYVSIVSFATVVGSPVGIMSVSFSLAFSIFTGIIKKLLKKKK